MNIKTINFITNFLSMTIRPGIEYWLNDGNHTYSELDKINWVLACLLSKDAKYWINHSLLNDIDDIYKVPDDRILSTRMIKYYKRKGMPTKKLYGFGSDFELEYNKRLEYIIDLCNKYSDISWKTKKHYDEENDPMFNGDFMLGLNTPLGPATFHLKLEHWDKVSVKEIEHGPKYDRARSQEVLFRLCSLVDKETIEQHKQSKKELQLKKYIKI